VIATRRDWDATSYHKVSSSMDGMAQQVLDRLPLRGDETVLDAGCGTGRVTAWLLERLPRGRVIGVDADPAMVALARSTLPASVSVIHSDLLDLTLPAPVDAVFSTATFHWVLDHDRLFARLAAAMRPGAVLVAQCGGHGNVAEVKQAGFDVAAEARFAPYFAGWETDWTFATPDETERRLHAAGFSDVWCWLTRVDVDPGDPAGYLRAICLGSFVERLPEELREPFVAAALERLPDPLQLHYVRLNILARA
jgi:trans-aconitate 2-methyltransferase